MKRYILFLDGKDEDSRAVVGGGWEWWECLCPDFYRVGRAGFSKNVSFD
jgi:hypothetical protein